jgi:hypothetical protein
VAPRRRRPRPLDGRDLADVTLAYIPRNVDVDDEVAAGLLHSMLAFLAFLDDVGDLSGQPFGDLAGACRELLVPCLERAGARAHWGPTKRLTAAMAADGVDLGDQLAVRAWIDGFNALSIAERDAVLGPLPRSRPRVTAAGRRTQPAARSRTKRRSARAARRRNR